MSYAEVKQMTTYETKTENIARGYQNGRNVTVTVKLNNGHVKMIDAFEGTIDYLAMEKIAGYPIGSKMDDNCKRIVWLDKYFVVYIPEPDKSGRTEVADFESLEDAIKFWVDCHACYRVIYQKRRLVNGKIDATTVAY